MIASIDHVVLTTRDMERTVAFYTEVLGMRREVFGDGRIALVFGQQKLNLQDGKSNAGVAAVADHPTPGSLDLCFLSSEPLDDVIAKLQAHGVPIELGPIKRTGARWPIRSIYLRDPDQNLIEIAEPWRE